ncbi:hypothetical protein ED5_3527 [Enterobacter roggenkampii]|nr:hypothetical protein ED5_3527 [Enterobacter roggenkampii]
MFIAISYYISNNYLIGFIAKHDNQNRLVHLVIYYFHPFFNCYYPRR